MDGSRFDELTKGLAAGIPRRKVVKGLAGGVVAGVAALLGRSGVDARRVTRAQCGNEVCVDDPGVCGDECVCCVWGNGNSRCMPPRDCRRAGGEAGGQAPGGNACSEGVSGCEGDEDLPICDDPDKDCVCVLTVSGDSFCSSEGFCFNCETDADCEESEDFGPGTRCVVGGDCCDGGGNFCGFPCGVEPPL